MLERMWKKGTLTHYWRGYKLMQPLWKMVWKFLKILKIRLPYMCAKSIWSCPVACHAPLSIGFSRWKYWSRLPCLPPWDLPNSRIKPMSLTSSALAGGFCTAIATWEAQNYHMIQQVNCLVYIWRKNETLLWKDTYTSMFIEVIFMVAELMKQTASVNRWTDKEVTVYMYIYTYIYVYIHIYTYRHTHGLSWWLRW